ncbi:hypothetical protein EON64_00085 [archaeon]|nr:MAG: hypothetical protein EON64_00085 [archaeon]
MNAQTSYGVVAAAHKSGKVALYKHSEGALQAVLAAAASYLVQNMHTGSNAVKKTCDMVNKLLEAHLKVLQDPGTLRSNSDDTVVALQGLNALSLAVSPAPLGQYAFQLNYCCADVIRTVVEIGDHYNRYQRSSKGDSAESDEANGEGTAGNNQSAFLVYCKSLFFCVVVSYLFNATVHCLSGTGQGGKLVVLENTASDQRLVQFLEELGVEVIVGYTKMYSKQQRFTRTAMVKLFIMHTLLGNRSDLTRKKHIADLYVTLTSLLDLAFLRTLARKESTDHIAADHARLSSYSVFSVEEDRLVFVYSSLWHALLKPTDKTLRLFCLDMLGLSFLDVVKQRLVQWLFSKCMSTIKSLQLTYSKAEEALQDVNNVGCLPDNIVDQDLFLNLVTFFEILVTLLDKQDTYNYADFVFVNVMEMSQKLPLLSGFYRMLSCLLIHLEDLLACGIHANNEQASVVSCMSQISIFVMKLQENLVASPNDYNNELLQSIVKVILSLPIECLSIDCMYITLHISLSSNIHLNKCIAMLNKHFTFDPKKFLNGTATSLLPLLSKYIVPISMENLSVNERHEYVSIGRKKLKTHLHSSNIVNSLQKQQVTTEQILLFLGKLGHHNQAMLQSPSEVIQDSLMWSAETKLSLQLSVSNQQGKLEIFIDKLLPTITEICRVKIDMTQTPNVNLIKALSSAAEALYNVVIFMIASSASLGVNYSDFYKRILPVVLQLASQSRINAFVVLFESLLDQLVSYFTSPHHRNSKNEEYGRVLLETLLENIVATNDNNMKELCGTTFTKYLQCCIHSHIRNRTEGSVNMKVIDTALEELCFLLSHPLESKQRAGLLLLSNVYKLIRSELVIVKRFSMFILYLLIKLLDVKDLSEENEKVCYPLSSYVRTRIRRIFYFILFCVSRALRH